MTEEAPRRSGWRFPVERRHVLNDPRRHPPEPILRRAGIEEGNAVVDVGAGTGFWTRPLAVLVGPSGRVIAVDVEPIMLDEIRAMAREGGFQNVEVVQSEEAHIPLPDGVADAATLGFVLHEPPDPAAFLGEVSRVLKPGGRMLVIEWHKRETEQGPPVEHRLSLDESRELIRAQGYRVEDLPSPNEDLYLLLGTR
jgi:ubiquinone/menaquinone biosynthesis C-methylase UbiE